MQIELQDLSMIYPNGKQALKNLNLDLKSPSLVGLLGPNGAGKSTLMKLLVAALMPIDELFSSQEVQMSNSPLESAVVDRVCGTRGMELRSEWAASLQSNYFVGDANLRCA